MSESTSPLKRAQKRLNDLYQESRQYTGRNQRSWHYVAHQTGLSVGTVIRVACEGYEPRDNRIRVALSLPQRVEVTVCTKCGQAHMTKRCTNSSKRTTPRRDWKRFSMLLIAVMALSAKKRGG